MEDKIKYYIRKNLANKKSWNSYNINFVYLIIIFFVLNNDTYQQSIIKLVIEGKGNINFLNNSFYLNPSNFQVNGLLINSSQKIYNFNNDINNVTIIFDNQIVSCEKMFSELTNIIEIDLSNLDTSKVISMNAMFNGCSNLEKIIFGNINTSLVEDMYELFHHCQKLTSIDLSI